MPEDVLHFRQTGAVVPEASRKRMPSKEQGFEGLMAKRLGSRYEPGLRTGAWTKIKNYRRQELVIGGWIPRTGRRHPRVDALVLGYWREAEFVSAGTVKTGFTYGLRLELPQLLGALGRDSSPFARGEVPRETVFVEPELVCEVQFLEWTARHGHLRHASFKGLRTDKPAADVVREDS
jgi:bifunctional non-homologous end joining protein LigD